MFYTWNLFYSLLLTIYLIGDVFGGSIPFRKSVEVRRRNAATAEVTMPDLGLLTTYVCPPKDTNTMKRQTSMTTIIIPTSELRNLLLELRLIEQQIIALIDALLGEDGSNSASATLVPLPTGTVTAVPISSLESAVDSILAPITATSNCSLDNAAVTTLTTTMGSTITITASFISSDTTSQVVATSITTAAPSSEAATSTSLDASSTTTSFIASATSPPETSIIGLESPSTTVLTASNGGVFIENPSGPAPTSSAAPPSMTSRAPSTSGYTFDAASSRNVAVYFGQTPATGGASLEAQCADPNVDIVILAFVISQLDGGPYPSINFGAACGGQTVAMASQAPGLLSCPALAANISNCQSQYGKKVLLSIGGATSQLAFASEAQATDFADVLWKLFGPPGAVEIDLRPFGTVQLDGFDVDIENHLPQFYENFGLALRAHFAASPAKAYYLSSAPQCPFPDASIPQSLILLCDFVFVQFYNNPPCEIGSAGFTESVRQWSTSLEASALASKPRLYVGAPAFAQAGQSAYANIGTPEGMRGVASGVEGLGLSNFGGVMFWDGPEGQLNVGGGKDIIQWAKEGLTQ